MYLFVLVSILFCNFGNILAQENCPFGHLDLVSDLEPDDCHNLDAGGYYTTENCLPICGSFAGSVTGFCDKDNPPCVPGYKCELQSNGREKCVADADTCGIYWVNKGTNDYYTSVFKPSCDKDSSYAPKQCKGEQATGRCFCFNKSGQRIFGQEWSIDAQNMTCACSRRKVDLSAKENGPFFVSLHCDNKGNFEPLQCDVVSEQCWCADEQTGDPTSPIVPQKALSKLPCYSSATTLGNQYLRQCESKKYAQARILNELKTHGTTAIYGTLVCDEDGAYGPYKILDGSAFCTWRDNANIGAWQSDATNDLSTLNCNCARDTVILRNAGKTMTQACDIKGNYKFRQVQNNEAYCVDSDGYRKSRSANEAQSEDACAALI